MGRGVCGCAERGGVVVVIEGSGRGESGGGSDKREARLKDRGSPTEILLLNDRSF